MEDKYINKLSIRAIYFVLVVSALVHCALTIYNIPYRVVQDYNEGWNVLFALRLLSDIPLYPLQGDYIFNNYPPISFYLVAAVSRLTGDVLVAGRIISLLSFVIIVLCLGRAVFVSGYSRSLSVFVGLMTWLIFSSNFGRYIGLNDPQMLAHAFMMLGLLLLLRAPDSKSAIVMASLLVLMAGFTKHILLPLPLAITIWLFLRNKSHFYIWVVAGFFGALVLFGVCALIFGGQMFTSLFAHERVISPYLMFYNFKFFMLIIPVVVLSFVGPSNKEYFTSAGGLFAIATVIAFVLAVLFRSGEGVSENAYFDVVFFGVPCAVLRLAALWRVSEFRAELRPLFVAIFFMISLPPLSLTPIKALEFRGWVAEGLEAHLLAVNRSIEIIASTPDPVICEMMIFCYWSGKPIIFDFFNVGQAAKSSNKYHDQLAERFIGREFKLIHVADTIYRLPPRIRQQIYKNYHDIEADDVYGKFLFPGEDVAQ